MPTAEPIHIARAASVLVRAPVRGPIQGRLVQGGDVFVILADEPTRDMAAIIASAAQALGARTEILMLDSFVSMTPAGPVGRPHKELPPPVRAAMGRAHSCVYLATAPAQERSMREQLLGIVGACGVRYAHLADVDPYVFVHGMCTDYDEVVKVGRAMALRLEAARVLETESDVGTRLRLSFSSEARWVSRLGEIIPGKKVAFPAGAIFATPEDVRGTFVADASVGEFFGAREGLLIDKPVVFTIENGRVVKVVAPSTELQGNIDAMLKFSANSDRVGLAAIGVNAGIRAATGQSVVDQNRVGLHVFIGNPAAKATGATWSARTSFAACQQGGRVLIDGRLAVADGRIKD